MVVQRTKSAAPAEGPTRAPPRRPARRPQAATNGATKPNGAATTATNGTAKGTTRAARPATRTAGPSVKKLSTELLAAIRRQDPDVDLGAIQRAIDFAIEAHGEQRRASGEPYVTHPIAAAHILADLDLDPTAIQAALLHDVPEDTEYDLPDIEE